MNSLGIALFGKIVIVKQEVLTGTTSDPLTRMFKPTFGLGLSPDNQNGSAVIGKLVGLSINSSRAAESWDTHTIDALGDIERLATEREIEVAQCQ
jgi:hypothetical protein